MIYFAIYIIFRPILTKMKILEQHVKRPPNLEPTTQVEIIFGKKLGQLTFFLAYFQVIVDDQRKEFVEEYIWPTIMIMIMLLLDW